MDVAYRRMVEADVPAIALVHRRACLIAYAFMDWSYSLQEVADWYGGKFASWDWGMVAEVDRKLVGFAATTGTLLDQLFVDPDHQRCGIGTSLMISALDRMPAGSAAILTVFEQNAPARRLYERCGFREVRRFLNEQEGAIELLCRRG
ncbi:MAG: GNAT family N-acetyltransferase [Bauldia sp.]